MRTPGRRLGALALGALALACSGQTDPAPARQPTNIDQLGCSSAQSLEADDLPCTVDFGDCGYLVSCDGAVDGTRACDCVVGGVVASRITASAAVCGAASADEMRQLSKTRTLPPSLTDAVTACGWEYRCCACRTRAGNPLFGVDVCE